MGVKRKFGGSSVNKMLIYILVYYNRWCIKKRLRKEHNLKSILFTTLAIHHDDWFHATLSFTFFNLNIFTINVCDSECSIQDI